MTTETDSASTGAAYELANAGYVPMPDPQEEEDRETIGGGNASLREAAAQRAEAPDDATVRRYTGPDGKPVSFRPPMFSMQAIFAALACWASIAGIGFSCA